jgi:hypothetical protein
MFVNGAAFSRQHLQDESFFFLFVTLVSQFIVSVALVTAAKSV